MEFFWSMKSLMIFITKVVIFLLNKIIEICKKISTLILTELITIYYFITLKTASQNQKYESEAITKGNFIFLLYF